MKNYFTKTDILKQLEKYRFNDVNSLKCNKTIKDYIDLASDHPIFNIEYFEYLYLKQ